MMQSVQPLALDSVMLDEARNYLRIETGNEDPALGAILLAAIGHAESFTRQIFIARQVSETLTAASGWQRLSASPVQSIISAIGIPADGASFVLEDGNWQSEIDRNGDAHIRIRRAGASGRVEVMVTAGIAQDWAELPETLRLAVLRLTGHLYNNRDGADDRGPPAAVAALLRPWRRMEIGGAAKS